MSKFLKLTDSIINIKYIHSIVIKPNRYHIYVMSATSSEGLKWATINVYDDSSDYKIVSDWIANQ